MKTKNTTVSLLACAVLVCGRAHAYDVSSGTHDFNSSYNEVINVYGRVTLNFTDVTMTNTLFLKGGSVCTLNITGKNSISLGGTNRNACIHLDEKSTLIINGTGSLTTRQNNTAAAIPSMGNGGSWGDKGGWQVIALGGTLDIDKFGGAMGYDGGRLRIYGGSVTIGELHGGAGGGLEPDLWVYGGNVKVAAVHSRISTIWLKIAGGSVQLPADAHTANPQDENGRRVYLNTLTFASGAGVNLNKNLIIDGTIQTNGNALPVQCDSKFNNGENDGRYGMKDVRTDAQGRVYLWLPAGETAAPYDIVQLSLHKCTPHRRAYSRPASAVSGALAWESIEVTYKCKGVGCNPNFEQKATVPPRCQ